jgi:hypothetical protein
MEIFQFKKIQSVTLCKINREEIGELHTDFIDNEKRNLNEIHELQLTIPKYVIDNITKEKKIFSMYDELKNKRLLLINEEEYFVIDNIRENKRKTEKNIVAYRFEYSLSKKNININSAYIQLLTEDLSDLNYPIYSINNELRTKTGWQFNEIENSILYDNNNLEKIRKIENINTDWYDFITNILSELFNFIPFFDTMNKTIDLISLENIGENLQLCLSYDNYMKELATTNDSRETVTRMNMESDTLNIASSVPTGYKFIDNFSYFIEQNEMSDELINALGLYEQMVEIRKPTWEELRNQKANKEEELIIKKNEWLITNTQLQVIQSQINIFKASNEKDDVARKLIEYDNKKAEEVELRNEVQSLEMEIELLNESINNIVSLCQYETCTDNDGHLIFSSSLLNELKDFIFEESYTEDNFLKELDMIETCKRKLELNCKPTVTYDIDVENFLDRIIGDNFRQQWVGTLFLGDLIILLDDDGNEEIVYMVGYENNYKDKSITLSLANKKTYKDNIRTVRDILRDSKKINKALSQNAYIINNTKNNRLNMENREIK